MMNFIEYLAGISALLIVFCLALFALHMTGGGF